MFTGDMASAFSFFKPMPLWSFLDTTRIPMLSFYDSQHRFLVKSMTWTLPTNSNAQDTPKRQFHFTTFELRLTNDDTIGAFMTAWGGSTSFCDAFGQILQSTASFPCIMTQNIFSHVSALDGAHPRR
jgi:hypothetical protein